MKLYTKKVKNRDTSEYWAERVKRKRSIQIRLERLQLMYELKPGRATVKN